MPRLESRKVAQLQLDLELKFVCQQHIMRILCIMILSAAWFSAARRVESQQVLSASASGDAKASDSAPEASLDTLLPLDKIEQDMSQPLSHYFISSSHNSYLDAGQMAGTTSLGAIERLLKLGFKVIEYDVYNGAPEPVVKHSAALTGQFTFRQGLEAIKKWAFTETDE